MFDWSSNFKFEHCAKYNISNDDLCFLISDNQIFLLDEQVPTYQQISKLFDLRSDDFYYFGKIDKLSCFCMTLDNMQPFESSMMSVRAIFNVLSFDLFHAAMLANHLTIWLTQQKYCGACGSVTKLRDHEFALKCDACLAVYYPTISPSIITVICRDDKILLAKSLRSKNNMYSCIAGFVNPGETIENALHREVMEEVGLEVEHLQYMGSQPWAFPNSLMLGFISQYRSGEIKVDYNELADAKWYHIDELVNVELPSEISISRYLINEACKSIREGYKTSTAS